MPFDAGQKVAYRIFKANNGCLALHSEAFSSLEVFVSSQQVDRFYQLLRCNNNSKDMRRKALKIPKISKLYEYRKD